jgi:hypothetical protein
VITIPWYPQAERRNIPPGPNDPPIHARIAVIHTMAGWIEGAEARFRDGSGVEAHFGVALDGRVWQWRDTLYQADAQAGGNDYCISVETEDGGQPETRWTPAQFDRLVELVAWLGIEHAIPMRLVTSTDERGIGYHRQFATWNPNAHSCPGDVRLAQLTAELLPTLQGADMALSDDDKTWIIDRLKESERRTARWVDHGDDQVTGSGNHHVRVREDVAAANQTLAQLGAKVDALKAAVDGLALGRLEGDVDFVGQAHVTSAPPPPPVADVPLPEPPA